MRRSAAWKYMCSLVLIVFLLGGCSPEEEAVDDLPVQDGFLSSGQLAVGGDGADEDFNARALDIAVNMDSAAEETVLQFTFVSGSRISGGEEEHEGCGVPTYSIYTLDNPARLVVDLDNLAHWDYRRGMDFRTGLVSGSFQHTRFGSPRVSVCFQLERPVRFRVDDAGDTLTVRLRAAELAEEEQPCFFVTLNAYEEYRTGTISPETDLSLTLAQDYENLLLISPPFATMEEAESYKRNSRLQYPSIAEDMYRIVELGRGELPRYDVSLDYLPAYQTPVVRLLEGGERTAPVRIPDGLYLCDLPAGGGCLYSKEIPGEEGDGVYQHLYIQQSDGKTLPATNFEFVSIERARFSPDGRRLAVLESTSGSTHLYIFDADTYELINDLSEMGFGGNTSAFIWNSTGNTIYAIAGASELQLHQFDYSIPDEAQRHSVIDRNAVDEGSLGYSDGELYFTHATMEEGAVIYRIKPEGGVRKPFMPGERFIISDNARYMAYASASETAGNNAGFMLHVFETGENRAITEEIYPYDFLWSRDCTKLFYIESRLSGGQTEEDTSGEEEPQGEQAEADPYPYTLWVYDVATGKNERLLDLSAPDIFSSPSNYLLYLNRMTSDDLSTLIRATYALDLQSIFELPEAPQEGQAQESPGALELE